MQVYKIPKSVLDESYHGCGKAWAAVKNGEVVAIRYMDDCDEPQKPAPAWAESARKAARWTDRRGLPEADSSYYLTRIQRAVLQCADRPRRPRGGDYRPSEYLYQARKIFSENDNAAFGIYRTRTRAELAELGEVMSGECSCTEFVVGL